MIFTLRCDNLPLNFIFWHVVWCCLSRWDICVNRCFLHSSTFIMLLVWSWSTNMNRSSNGKAGSLLLSCRSWSSSNASVTLRKAFQAFHARSCCYGYLQLCYLVRMSRFCHMTSSMKESAVSALEISARTRALVHLCAGMIGRPGYLAICRSVGHTGPTRQVLWSPLLKLIVVIT